MFIVPLKGLAKRPISYLIMADENTLVNYSDSMRYNVKPKYGNEWEQSKEFIMPFPTYAGMTYTASE